MKIQRQVQQGFTLIELMIVVAIIGILAAIAIPQYTQYTRKAKFTEVISQTKAVKVAVELCLQDQNNVLASCDGGSNGIPADVAATVGKLAGLTTLNSIITATAVSTGGLSGETYILTPSAASGSAVVWTASGTCTTAPAIC